MKKLIYSDKEAIKNRQEFANQLVNVCNTVLTRFDRHNHFGQPISEEFARQLINDPVGSFDELLRANSPIKPIAGKPLDIQKLSELTGIDRAAAIRDFTVTMPGTVDRYRPAGTVKMFKLAESNRHLVSWKNGAFVLNEKQLEADCDRYNSYAESPEQIAELEYWENLANVLNAHVDRKDRKFMDISDINLIAHKFGLQDPMSREGNKRFVPNYRELAKNIQKMLVN